MKVFLLTIFLISGYNAQSPKVGQSTRYWDCCKPSCAWSGKATVTKPVLACSADGVTNVDMNAGSGCNGGNSYTCSNNQPWAINSTVSYGFVAAKMVGLTESNWCCACYQMTFTSGPVVGKKMVVQVTNTGGDLGDNHFDIQIPGGGVGLFNGCISQWGAPDAGWGQRYGGVSSRSDCDALPAQIRAGCQWRFDWFLNADNPSFTFIQVTCPAAITAKTGCIRTA